MDDKKTAEWAGSLRNNPALRWRTPVDLGEVDVGEVKESVGSICLSFTSRATGEAVEFELLCHPAGAMLMDAKKELGKVHEKMRTAMPEPIQGHGTSPFADWGEVFQVLTGRELDFKYALAFISDSPAHDKDALQITLSWEALDKLNTAMISVLAVMDQELINAKLVYLTVPARLHNIRTPAPVSDDVNRSIAANEAAENGR